MSSIPKSANSYQVGGSLPSAASTYVVREADKILYIGLKTGSFCYVLNSRQMGKSSLRVRIMKKLQEEGFVCCAIEMRDICGYEVTPDEFFGGFLSLIVSGLDLDIDVGEWWYKYEYLSPLLRLSKFIEEKFLNIVSQNIVIFVDELDNVLSLKFKDDFFAFVRGCYNKRAENYQYNRLTFALLGVATPKDLIANNNLTPFNIDSQAVELVGFQYQQAIPLEKGLIGIVSNTKAVLQEILKWTGGQPFLTQWLCQLVCSHSSIIIDSKSEALGIAKIVKERIIDNWWTQDRQQHLQTIKERLLSNESRSCRLLGLYQQILIDGEITADDSSEQMELRLSGLVVKQQGKLRVYNRIYERVFNWEWIERQLANLRPYFESLNAWVNSNYQDESRFLRGEALQEALEWAEGKSIGDLDYQFLAASQELEKRKIKLELETTQKANQILSQAQTKAKRLVRFGFLTMSLTMFLGILIVPMVLRWLPIYFNNRALEQYNRGRSYAQINPRKGDLEIQQALDNYEKALMLKPNYPQAHYGKGSVYEYIGDSNNARVHYEAAVLSKFPKAYNNLARLYILDRKYDLAAKLLEESSNLPKKWRTEYNMLKTLGWLKLEQKRYLESEKYLRQSIAIQSKQGAAYCLLARLFEDRGMEEDALKQWESCLKFSSPHHIEEKNWINIAKQRLSKK
ncbi:MAG: AAA-like domain-containing protein [Rivularia sp. (in: cyanobacteria)]